jgi:hypothetical protein
LEILNEDEEIWYGQSKLIFEYEDLNLAIPLILVKIFDFVDDKKPVDQLYKTPWIKATDEMALITPKDVIRSVHLHQDTASHTQFYVELQNVAE